MQIRPTEEEGFVQMETEEKKRTAPLEEMMDKARELTGLLKETEIYQRYSRDLARLKSRPETCRELNTFRRRHLELQLQDETEDQDEKEQALQVEYKNILMEAEVMDFLTSEQAVCRMMRQVYDVLAQEMEIDVSYMDEEE